MLRNFETPHQNPLPPTPPASQGNRGQPLVSQTRPIRTRGSEGARVATRMVGVSRAYLFKEPADWDWEDLRDYSVEQITEVSGPFEFDATKANSVFRAFMKRHPNAPQIARYVFDILGGLWYAEPVGIYRFYRGQDPYFADPITRLLNEAE